MKMLRCILDNSRRNRSAQVLLPALLQAVLCVSLAYGGDTDAGTQPPVPADAAKTEMTLGGQSPTDAASAEKNAGSPPKRQDLPRVGGTTGDQGAMTKIRSDLGVIRRAGQSYDRSAREVTNSIRDTRRDIQRMRDINRRRW